MTMHPAADPRPTDTPHRAFLAEVTVAAPPDAVFPLLCPTLEYAWIPGWSCTLIHSVSGRAELGCVFRTEHDGGLTWVVSRYEPGRAIDFVRVAPQLWTTVLSLALAPAPGGSTRLRALEEATALTDRGTAALAELPQDHLQERWTGLGALIDAYLTPA